MKNLLVLFAFVLCGAAHAAGIPFTAEAEDRFQKIEQRKTAKFVYNVATNGGSAAAHGLGVHLPANSIILRDYFYIDTQFVDAGSGTVALHCEDANNIFTAADITLHLSGSLIDGESTGASTLFKKIDAQCELTATVATAAQTAGKLTGWVEYIVRE